MRAKKNEYIPAGPLPNSSVLSLYWHTVGGTTRIKTAHHTSQSITDLSAFPQVQVETTGQWLSTLSFVI